MNELVVAILLSFVIAVFILYTYIFVWRPQIEKQPTVPDRGSFASFVEATPHLDDNDKAAEPALILVDHVSKQFDELHEAARVRDSEATTILGFLGGGVSVYALAVGAKVTAQPSLTALVGLALICFLASLFACVLCLAGRRLRGRPELNELAQPTILDDAKTTKARVAAYVFLKNQDRFDEYRRINTQKGCWLFYAQYMFVIGAVILVLNSFVLASYGPS